jgi:hypothetical protein
MLLIGVENPSAVCFDLEDEELSLVILLEVDQEKLVGLHRRHFTRLWPKISTEDESCAD